MNKLVVSLVLVFATSIVIFSTWQLFTGNLTAAFSAFPFLIITYLFVLRIKRQSE